MPRGDSLKSAAANKSQRAYEKTDLALKEMKGLNEAITFTSVARKAGVTTQYLYGHPELRQRIESAKNSAQPNLPVPAASSASNRVIISKLKERIQKLEQEVKEKDAQLSAVYTKLNQQLIQLRELDRLKDLCTNLEGRCKALELENKTLKVSGSPESIKPVTSLDGKRLEIQIQELGIPVNSTLRKAIQSSSEESVKNAIEAYRITAKVGNIYNPGGWLREAILGGWTVIQAGDLKGPTTDEQKSWLDWAQFKGLLVYSMRKNNGEIDACIRHNGKEISMPLHTAMEQYPMTENNYGE